MRAVVAVVATTGFVAAPILLLAHPAGAGAGVEGVAELGNCTDREPDGTIVVPPDGDGDGLPDFGDSNGDGIPDIATGNPGDLDILCTADLQRVALEEAFRGDPAVEEGTLVGPCFGAAYSFDADGNIIDGAVDFDDGRGPVDIVTDEDPKPPAGTADNPFELVGGGLVLYAGEALHLADTTSTAGGGKGPRDHTWQIAISFGPIDIGLDEGGDDNPEREDQAAGSVDLASNIPSVSGLFRAEGFIENDAGFRCEGAMFFAFVDANPLLNPIGILGTLFAGGALLGAFFNARPALTWIGSESTPGTLEELAS